MWKVLFVRSLSFKWNKGDENNEQCLRFESGNFLFWNKFADCEGVGYFCIDQDLRKLLCADFYTPRESTA